MCGFVRLLMNFNIAMQCDPLSVSSFSCMQHVVTSLYSCFDQLQTKMSVLQARTPAHALDLLAAQLLAQTRLAPTPVAARLDLLWLVTASHAVVSWSIC